MHSDDERYAEKKKFAEQQQHSMVTAFRKLQVQRTQACSAISMDIPLPSLCIVLDTSFHNWIQSLWYSHGRTGRRCPGCWYVLRSCFLTNFAHHQAERENGVPIRVPWNRLEHSELEWRMLARLLLARVIDLWVHLPIFCRWQSRPSWNSLGESRRHHHRIHFWLVTILYCCLKFHCRWFCLLLL